METKDYSYLAVIAVLVIGSVTYNVYLSGNELKCATGNGWEITADRGYYFESACQYKTKAWTYANCSSFRGTATYARYYCTEAYVVPKQDINTEPAQNQNRDGKIIEWTCYPSPRGCEPK